MSYIELPFPLSPIEPLNFALIEDKYLKGSFRVLPTQAELNNLEPTTIKQGMLVLCEDSKILWRAAGVVESVDEWGDPISVVDWKIFKFQTEVTQPKPNYSIYHTNFTVSLENIGDQKYFEFEKDLGCYSFILMNLALNIPVQFQIFSNKTYKDINPYTFIARYDHLVDNGNSVVARKGFPDKFNLKTSAYNIIVNDDSPLSTKFYFRIKKDSRLTEFKSYDTEELLINFDYVTLET